MEKLVHMHCRGLKVFWACGNHLVNTCWPLLGKEIQVFWDFKKFYSHEQGNCIEEVILFIWEVDLSHSDACFLWKWILSTSKIVHQVIIQEPSLVNRLLFAADCRQLEHVVTLNTKKKCWLKLWGVPWKLTLWFANAFKFPILRLVCTWVRTLVIASLCSSSKSKGTLFNRVFFLGSKKWVQDLFPCVYVWALALSQSLEW